MPIAPQQNLENDKNLFQAWQTNLNNFQEEGEERASDRMRAKEEKKNKILSSLLAIKTVFAPQKPQPILAPQAPPDDSSAAGAPADSYAAGTPADSCAARILGDSSAAGAPADSSAAGSPDDSIKRF
ncbi:hypothetical protein CRE_23146 [Caenorhabditis remanei]|uniref:Uncharacterized protein n=1 Tax=Caenorhabditis remanei TaxID=31234 RepID=E3NFW3_CAERE|nr:hypothetical protein CRE_23146 [Caenorhabditis remanei]